MIWIDVLIGVQWLEFVPGQPCGRSESSLCGFLENICFRLVFFSFLDAIDGIASSSTFWLSFGILSYKTLRAIDLADEERSVFHNF